MNKIISLFKRDYEGNRRVYNEVVTGAEWVQRGEGVATEKMDGTACLIRDGKLYKRYDCKRGKTPPDEFIPAQDPDPVTGHWPGWVAVTDVPENRWHREAISHELANGTYELVGPKVQGNPYHLNSHLLRRHGDVRLIDVPTDYDGIRDCLVEHAIEGIVWHHSDGRMVKIKAKDFGIQWPRQGER